MDMELTILMHTAGDFSVTQSHSRVLFGALRVLAFALVALCAVGHVADRIPATGTVQR